VEGAVEQAVDTGRGATTSAARWPRRWRRRRVDRALGQDPDLLTVDLEAVVDHLANDRSTWS
jgi:hypothetical protein